MSMCTAKALSSLGSSIPPLAPGMRRIFIVRHGQTDWNVQRRIQGGGADLELNKMGEAQAAAAAAELANVGPFSVVASSHLVRAKRTADHIAIKHPDARRIVDERFGEMRFGKFEGAELGADAEAAKEVRLPTPNPREGDPTIVIVTIDSAPRIAACNVSSTVSSNIHHHRLFSFVR